MRKVFDKYCRVIKETPFFIHNDFKANFIFVIGLLFFFVLAEDLGSEMAKEKDEVSYLVATLIVSVDSINFNTVDPMLFPPEIYSVLEIEDFNISKHSKYSFHSGRSPPLS